MDKPIAIVTWVDSSMSLNEYYESEIADLEPAVFTSVGYLLRQDEKVLVLAMDHVEHAGEPPKWRIQITIPACNVQSVEFLGRTLEGGA